MKKIILSGIGIGGMLLFLILVIALKDDMNNYLSSSMMMQVSTEAKNEGQHKIDSLYNYSLSEEAFQLTFLEFGAEGCISCRKMKIVMEKVKTSYPKKVNVVFMNSLQSESQELMKLFGVVTIPTQILLDENGKEYYRHSGYISFEDLSKEFN